MTGLNGLINGKFWGSKDKQTILCIHGWQDNANTFDTLIPQLPSEFSYFAIDLQGHGFSSHGPKGRLYKYRDMVVTIRRVQNYFNWPKVSFIGHSFGAMCSFLFSTFYPNDVNFFVAIDAIKPLGENFKKAIDGGGELADKLLAYDSEESQGGAWYSRDDLMKIWITGANNSLTEETCRILMERGIIEKNGLFRLRRDPKIKYSFFSKFTQKDYLLMAENVNCRVMYIKATDVPYFEKKEDVIEFVNALRKSTSYFEEHSLPGTHHLHLNTPQVVAPIISAFIKSSIQK